MMAILTLTPALLLSQMAYAEPSEELAGIYEALIAEGSDYSGLKAQYTEYYPEVTFEETLEDDGFTISASGNEYMDGSWTYTADGDYLTANFSGEDFTGYALVMYVVNAIGDYFGMDSHLLSGYVNGLSSLNIPNDNFTLTSDEEAGTIEVRMNMAGPYDMKELDEMVIGETELEYYGTIGEEYRSYASTMGKLTIVANGNADDFTVLLGEYEELDDLAYQSIINVATYMQPKGWEEFVESYTELAEAETPGYTVSLDVDEKQVKEIVDDIYEGYHYAIIHFGA